MNSSQAIDMVLVRPIHIITSEPSVEKWPKASYALDEEVFVRSEPGVYTGGQIVLILPTERGETIYAVRLARTLVLRTKAELTK